MLDEVLPPLGGLVVNYGLERVRFPAPVPNGSRVRGRFRLAAVTDEANGCRLQLEATVEREGFEKPACAAVLLLLLPG